MSTITIPACQFQPGDILDLGGQPLTVLLSSRLGGQKDERVVYFRSSTDEGGFGDNHQIGSLHLPNDALFIVTRPEPPDPDAGVIEAMAEWLSARDDRLSLAELTAESAEFYRGIAREMLAVAREAGAL